MSTTEVGNAQQRAVVGGEYIILIELLLEFYPLVNCSYVVYYVISKPYYSTLVEI